MNESYMLRVVLTVRGRDFYPNVLLYSIGLMPVLRLKKHPKRLGDEKFNASPICWMVLFSSYSM